MACPNIPVIVCSLRFQVEDTGAGIAAEDQERIFEPFVQVGRPGSQQGTGLGLTITRQFVELMGGTIRVESTRGKGSRFCVLLPAELTQEPVAMTASSDGAQIAGLEPGQPECRILIVEDEPANRMVLERLLHDAGFQVRAAGDGSLGWSCFGSGGRTSSGWICVCLLMDGITTARQHSRARRWERGEDRSSHRVGICQPAKRRPGGGNGRFLCVSRTGRVRSLTALARQLGVRYRRSEAVPASLRAPGLRQ